MNNRDYFTLTAKLVQIGLKLSLNETAKGDLQERDPEVILSPLIAQVAYMMKGVV